MGMYDIRAVEKEINALWKKINVKDLVKKQNSKGKPYFLLDGPPYANNIPHVGHIRNTVYKDMYIRIASMKGFNVLFKPGFDTHGLPIENMVEKKLGFKDKNDILKYGVSKFVSECKANATNYKDLWMKTFDALGSYYADETPYCTYDNDYLESGWWAFKQFWDKGLVYEGKKPVFWCPHCQTALAGYESTDSYKVVTDPSVYLKFKVLSEEFKDSFILVFTTTPWTLPANVALAVHPEKDYVLVQTDKGNLILAKNRLELLDRIKVEYSIKKRFKGEKLVGLKYQPLLKVPEQEELSTNPIAHQVYASIPMLKERVASKTSEKKGIKAKDVFEDFVTDSDGTGVVHTAPGHGKTDNMFGHHYKLPAVSPLDDECKFTDMAGKYQGKFVKDADHDIMEDLHKEGKLLHYEKIQHKYPLCWRCKSPLIFKLNNSWFINVDPLKQKMLDANEEVNWQPDFAKDRMRNWLANLEDWNFSRQRFWGIPIPIWKSEDGDFIVIDSKKEFIKLTGAPENVDLHAASEYKIKKNGKIYERIPEIFDVWYDSGCAPFASWHYPFENKKLFEEHYPVNRINEAQDQVRGWFYYLMNVNMGVFDKAPYKTISMPGWVLDAKGEKMSKSMGNFIGADEACETLGADVVRFYYCWEGAPFNTMKFNESIAKSDVFRFMNILWNLHEFVLNEDFKINAVAKTMEDKWILSRLNSVIKFSTENLEEFNIHLAGKAIYDFVVEDLSRKYVQIIRDRTSNDSTPYSIIYRIIKNIIILLTPIAPHISEKIYQNFKIKEPLKSSVQLETLPKTKKIDKSLEDNFEEVFDLIGTILAARDSAKIGLRWPIKTARIQGKKLSEFEELIKNQTNIKEIDWKIIALDFDLKPNYRNLGKKLGPQTADFITAFNANKDKFKECVEKGCEFNSVKINKEDFEITAKVPDNFSFAEGKKVKVLLDLTMTPELIAEGESRELIRRIQILRKDAGLTKEEKIKLQICGNLVGFDKEIKSVTGATEILFVEKINAKNKSKFKIKEKDFEIGF